ncbi:helix-turn-helix domain-containing protein [[Kitasatospora] papulosa]|uniref:helix-turn-helix domain-containing protein n=1 Tax=[Kitasatospora] papulosa TaxID=1464011 RepID=UPI00367CAD2F
MLDRQSLQVVPDSERTSDSPAGAGLVLGAYLRQLRKSQGLRLSDVVNAGIVGSVPTLSRIERAATPLREETVLALARHYGVTDVAKLDVLCTLTRHSRNDDWWSGFRDVVPGWMERLISVEASARTIRTYELQYIPGLLQTSAYTRALMQAHHKTGMDAAERERSIERRVEVRANRRKLLAGSSAPQYYAVLDQSILVRRVGGKAVMREQLRELYNMEENREHVHLRVLPFDRGADALAPASSITYLTFPSGQTEDVLYLEVPDGGTYVTQPGDIKRYMLALSSLWGLAASRAETMEILDQRIGELRD